MATHEPVAPKDLYEANVGRVEPAQHRQLVALMKRDGKLHAALDRGAIEFRKIHGREGEAVRHDRYLVKGKPVDEVMMALEC